MQPVPYLFFNGTCEEAIRAYARVFGSPEPEIMYAKDTPEGETSGIPNAVMHAALKVGEGWLYASDYSKAERMAGASIILTHKTVEDSRRVFDALAEGGEVEMPFEATFWSPAFGAFTDRWGTRWMIDTEGAPAAQGAPETAEATA
jgi:PhnB protein